MFVFKPSFILQVIPQLLRYLPVTLLIMAASVLLGTLLGAALARAKQSRNPVFRLLANAYTTVLRCTPTIVLLFLVFYALPGLLQAALGINVSGAHKSVYTIITLAMIHGATSSELMRSAWESVDRGQREAAVSMGLSDFQAFTRIVLPQCFVVAWPNFANSLVSLIKEAALAYHIGLIDIMGKAYQIVANNYNAYALETYLGISLIYWGLSLLVQRSVGIVENHLQPWRRTISAQAPRRKAAAPGPAVQAPRKAKGDGAPAAIPAVAAKGESI